METRSRRVPSQRAYRQQMVKETRRQRQAAILLDCEVQGGARAARGAGSMVAAADGRTACSRLALSVRLLQPEAGQYPYDGNGGYLARAALAVGRVVIGTEETSPGGKCPDSAVKSAAQCSSAGMALRRHIPQET